MKQLYHEYACDGCKTILHKGTEELADYQVYTGVVTMKYTSVDDVGMGKHELCHDCYRRIEVALSSCLPKPGAPIQRQILPTLPNTDEDFVNA